nr:hypothetical protein CFP56_71608 [Quercus suber]
MSSSFIPPTTPLFDEQHSGTRKRSRDEAERPPKLDQRSFAIRAPDDNPFAAPRSFTPVTLISRARLPLHYLDATEGGSPLFSSYIPVLQAAHEYESDACILIAEDKIEGILYAVERVKARTYSLCRLASSLSRENVEAMLSAPAMHDIPQRERSAVPSAQPGQPWWMSAAVEHPMLSTSANTSYAATPKLVMLAGPADGRRKTLPETLAPTPDVPPVVDPDVISSSAFQIPPQDQLQELAKQYLEALYSSRAPLAYFIKGPLSRARAAFAGDDVSPPRIAELIAFLRDSILGSSIIDKKYRDILPNLVTELSLQGPITPQVSKAKRKKRWKAKRDKAGLFSCEKEYIKIWWNSHDSGATSAETQEFMVKRRCTSIRGRETFLQVVLILEVLALEESIELRPNDPSTATPIQTNELEADENAQKAKQEKKSKSKNMQDLAALLDNSIDKLCIWHSLQASSPMRKKDNDTLPNESNDNDELVNFCRDNIIPFFVSRIPKIAVMVNKKLGGPSAPTPAKHKLVHSRKPGEPASRPHIERPVRKPLARVATDTIGLAPKRVPMLHRSTTDIDTMPFIKREPGQDESFSSNTSARPRQPAPRRRADLARSISISGREVDFSAMSQANEIKLRKKADLKERLRKEAKEAIDAIRKPNRQLAVKEYAEETDLSFAKATAKTRPSQKHRPSQVSQIDATPARPRAQYPTWRHGGEQPGRSQNLSSGQSVIPGSSAKLQAGPYDLPQSSFAVPATGQRPRHVTGDILDTPSRGFAKFMPPGLVHPPGMLDSPDAVRHSAIQQTPSKPIKQLVFSVEHEVGLQADTPVVRVSKPRRTFHAPPASPTDVEEECDLQRQRQAVAKAGTTSIYAELGWDEEYEELS